MNMKVKLRTADKEIIHLKSSLRFWKNMGIIFGLGFFALLVLLLVVTE